MKPLGLSLAAGLEALGLTLDAARQGQLLAYLALIAKWNKVYNLTAVRDPADMLTHHLLDSLALLPFVPPGRLLDVGSGPGLPAIPLAIARPELAVTALDSSQKKTTFQRQACIELGLRNVRVECRRVEDFQPSQPFDAVVSRAFAEVGEFVRLSARLCAPDGRLLAMKGLHPTEELAHLPSGVHLEAVHPLSIPGLAAQRHVAILSVRPADSGDNPDPQSEVRP